MYSNLALTIITVVLSVAALIASALLAIIFYVMRKRKLTRQCGTSPMMKPDLPGMLSSKTLLQLRQKDYDRVYSDSDDSGAVLGRWSGRHYTDEQMCHSVDNSADDLSDFEYPERRSSSFISSSSCDGWPTHEEEETNVNESFHSPTSSSHSSPNISSRVCFLNLSLKYDFHQGSLTLVVINASRPPKQSSFSKALFVVVQLFQTKQNGEVEDIDMVFKTDIKPYSTNVLFNQKFTYEDIQHNELEATSIRLSLCSHDRFSRVQAVGDFIVDLSDICLDPTQPIVLQRRLEQEVSPVAIEVKDKGELSLSLRCQRGSRRISVIVLKAAKLKKPKKLMSNDCYITVKLFYNDQVVSKKKTKVKKGASSLCWNEPFAFDLEEVNIDEYLIVFAVKGRDLFSSCTKLGTVSIGARASSSTGKEHWNDSVHSKTNTMRQVTMSHKLL